jgi:glycosyltransferase involved in cell wall biosynthesis
MPGFITRNKVLKRYLLAFYFSKIDISGYDIVHSHGDNFLLFFRNVQIRTFYGSALMEFLSARTVRRRAAQFFSVPLEWLGALAANRSIVISPETSKYIPFVHNIIPCGVDRTIFYPSGDKEKSPVIMFIGSLYDRKRGDTLVAMMPRIREIFPGALLRVAGANSVNVVGVEYLGRPSRQFLAENLRRAWVLVSPSEYEGFGLPALEAMACGTAVVAVENAGSRYLLADGKYGLLCSKDNLSRNIIELLKDNVMRENFICAGKKRAEELDIMNVAGKYMREYEKLADN